MSAYEAAGKSDDWFTPAHLFDALGEEFDLDVAADQFSPLHGPCDCRIYRDSLETA